MMDAVNRMRGIPGAVLWLTTPYRSGTIRAASVMLNGGHLNRLRKPFGAREASDGFTISPTSVCERSAHPGIRNRSERT